LCVLRYQKDLRVGTLVSVSSGGSPSRHSRWSGGLSSLCPGLRYRGRHQSQGRWVLALTAVALPVSSSTGWESLSALSVVCLSLSPGLSWAGTHHVFPESRMMHSRGRPSANSRSADGFSACRHSCTLVSSSTGWESLLALSVVCLSLSPGLPWAGTHRVLRESRSHSRGRPSAEDSRSADGFWL